MMDFWARRKEAVAEEALVEAQAAEALEASEAAVALEERSDEEVLEELGLAEPERLETSEAVREFLASAVPQRLKTRALRQLWKLNPVLANLDGLVDYGEDFTDSATVIENLQTAYQVGKGMLAHIEEMAKEASEAAPEASESEEEAEVVVLAEERGEAPEQVRGAAVAEADVDADYEAAAPVALASRRMAFRFEEV